MALNQHFVKLNLKSARLRDVLRIAITIAQECSVEVYLVGGFVRDWLRGIESTDIDLVVAGDPFEYGRALARKLRAIFVPMHDAPPVARVVVKRSTPERTIHIDISAIQGALECDLRNRDFTINALAIPLDALSPIAINGTATEVMVLDVSTGLEDLHRGVIRPTRVMSEELFADDPVRMLRAFRFAGMLGFNIHQDTLTAMRRCSHMITRSSWERIRDEFSLTLQSPRGGQLLLMMDEVGLLSQLLPELQELKRVPGEGYHHLDGFHHSIESVCAVERIIADEDWVESDWEDLGNQLRRGLRHYIREFNKSWVERRTGVFVLKMSALLHDIAKPHTMQRDEEGDLHFFEHERLGSDIAHKICERFKLSKRETAGIVRIVRAHMRPLSLASAKSLTMRALRRFWLHLDELGMFVIIVSLADLLATRGVDMTVDYIRRHLHVLLRLLEAYREVHALRSRPRLLSGYDVMQRYGVPRGPLIGKALRAIEEAQLNGRIRTREEAIALLDELMPKLMGGQR